MADSTQYYKTITLISMRKDRELGRSFEPDVSAQAWAFYIFIGAIFLVGLIIGAILL